MDADNERQRLQAEREDTQAKLDRNAEHREALEARLREIDQREAQLEREAEREPEAEPEPVEPAPEGESRTAAARDQTREEHDEMMKGTRTRDTLEDKEELVERVGEEQVTRSGGQYGPDPRETEAEERREREAREEREREEEERDR